MILDRFAHAALRVRHAFNRLRREISGTMNGTHFRYDKGTVPLDYKCADCGRHGCKLWREYQTFADIDFDTVERED